jgi:hypothetical protein
VLVILVALLWSGVRAAGFGPPPVILPPSTPLRVAPADPGGLTLPEANVQIMSGDVASAPAALAPAPVSPDVAQLNQAAGISPPPAPVAAAVVAQVVPAQVQLAAAKDEPGALAVWDRVQAQMPGLFGGKHAQIVPSVVNGQSVWLLLVPGFASGAAAQAFCAQVVAKGGACQEAGL